LRNKIRFISGILSLLLIVALFGAGCAPQQRPEPEKFGTRFDLGNENARYNTNERNGWYDRSMDKYGYNPGRDYGFYNNNGPEGYDGIPDNMGRYGVNLYGGNERALRTRFEEAVEGINGVDDATVIVNNNSCYVGVDTDDNRINNTAALRSQITNRVRQIDPNINRVYVTTDDQGLNRLRNYARDIDAGQPIRNFLDDIEDLFR